MSPHPYPYPYPYPAPALAPTDLEALHECWRSAPHRSVKITSYFPAYVQLFSHLRGRPCTFIETGILDGGSLFMWRKWLGPQARIIGIDLNPEVAKWRQYGFEIFIGDQGDPDFWRTTLAQIGEFDALLDDGGHQSFQQIVTLREALRARRSRCVIAIEDTTTSFMKDFANHGDYSFLQYAKESTDCLAGRTFPMAPDRYPSPVNTAAVDFFKDVLSIQFYSGIVAFHVDPEHCVTPKIITNLDRNLESDFRYEGRDAAEVEWPSVLKTQTVTVHGGMRS